MGTYLPSCNSLLCVSPPYARAPVTISLNAQQYAPALLSFYAAPTIDSLSPNSGPVLGDTLIKVNGGRLPDTGPVLCRIGQHIAVGTRLNHTAMRCLSPTLHLTGTASAAGNGFPSWAFESSRADGDLLVAADGRELLLSGRGRSSSLVFQVDVAALAMTSWEASFHGCVRMPAFAQAAAPIDPSASTASRASAARSWDIISSARSVLGMPAPHFNFESLISHFQRLQHGPAAATAFTVYSLSFGDLNAATPTGRGSSRSAASAQAAGCAFVLQSRHRK